MADHTLIHAPRLYLDAGLVQGADIPLSAPHAHYLRNVVRCDAGDSLRLFNPSDGEWAATLLFPDKKSVSVRIGGRLRPPVTEARRVHLFFAPIRKERMDFLVEKSVELGATDLHPVLTHRTGVRQINADRMRQQMIEAAEQCERLDIPALHPLCPLKDVLRIFAAEGFGRDATLYAALERHDGAVPISSGSGQEDIFYLVGPEGGFDDEEKEELSRLSFMRPVSLGERILRAETAALYGLIRLVA